jgi:hypothetical protein
MKKVVHMNYSILQKNPVGAIINRPFDRICGQLRSSILIIFNINIGVRTTLLFNLLIYCLKIICNFSFKRYLQEFSNVVIFIKLAFLAKYCII